MIINNPEKVFWPKHGYTKKEMISYYDQVAPYMLPHIHNRPIVLKRYPDGITGTHFFQKNLEKYTLPDFLETIKIKTKSSDKDVLYPVIQSKESLLWLTNLATVEFHMFHSKKEALETPDILVFDLDPGPICAFSMVVDVALCLQSHLRDRQYVPYVKTTGKRGLHIYIKNSDAYTHDEGREFANKIALAVTKYMPNSASTAHWPDDRPDKVFIDTGRNALGQTTIAPYSLRATPDATVSTPLLWEEVQNSLSPEQFTVKTIVSRLQTIGDPWRELC
jgi:bifunctional non-homologous end joining protein LigD